MYDHLGCPWGIDHDFCFPTNNRKLASDIPNTLIDLEDGFVTKFYEEHNYVFCNMLAKLLHSVDCITYTNYCFPPFIDVDMCDAFIKIDIKKLEEIYCTCKLTESEIVPALKRLLILQERIMSLPQEKVLDPRIGWENLSTLSKEELYHLGMSTFNSYAVHLKYNWY